jgi:CPA2 family monovalent cation:H+ antiporter-2
MQELHLLTDLAIAIAFALAGGLLARLVGLSPIVGYLAAGIAISPFTPGFDGDIESLQELAELGVIFLMFGVGLHFNLKDLFSVKNIAIPGALAQIAAATLLGLGVGLLFDLPWRESLVLGLAISVASTVVLIRALEERSLTQSIHGRVAVGWLVVEDLVTILVLALLPSLEPNGDGNALADTAWALGKAAAFVLVMLALGPRILPPLLSMVARTGSRELFTLSIVAAALGIAVGGATVFDVSIALGAFIAGIVVSETETSHQAAADVVPFRDAFAVLFFVSVGMLVDPDLIFDNLGLLLAVTLIVLFGKSVVALVVAGAFPYPGRTGLTVAVGLAQIGEFSFIIANEGMDLDIIGPTTYNIVLAVAVISIALNPLAFASTPRVEGLMKKRLAPFWRRLDHHGELQTGPVVLEDHVVIAGGGRVGQLVAHTLQQVAMPAVILEANLEVARTLQSQGYGVVWGDAASREVLESAGLNRAKIFVLAVPDEDTALLSMVNARQLNPELPIIARARHRDELDDLYARGAHEVVVPEIEGGLELMRQSLAALGFDSSEALAYADAIRDTVYGPGRAGQTDSR